MPKFSFSKLVRDNIIDHQITSGARPVYHQLSPKDHKNALVDKIIEEAREITAAKADEIAGEIADVQQAIDDLVELYGLSKNDIAVAQARKNSKNGAFKKGLYIDYVEIPEGDKWVDYYRQNADRYPEL